MYVRLFFLLFIFNNGNINPKILFNLLCNKIINRWASKVILQVENKAKQMNSPAQPPTTQSAKQPDSNIAAFFFGSAAKMSSEEHKGDEEMMKLYRLLQDHIQSEAGSAQDMNESPNKKHPARTEEYYWLVGEFSLKTCSVKIEREVATKNKSGRFKEAIVLVMSGIETKFLKRFKGLDLDAKMMDLKISAYSTFTKKVNINNVVVSRNPEASQRELLASQPLAAIFIKIFPPNSDIDFEMVANFKSLKFYYLPLLAVRVLTFIGNQDTMKEEESKEEEEKKIGTVGPSESILSNKKAVEDALNTKKYSISISIDSPVFILPILKNGDACGPVWSFKLGNMSIKSIVSHQILLTKNKNSIF